MSPWERVGGFAAFLLASSCSARAAGPAAVPRPFPIEVSATALPLSVDDARRTTVGELTWAGGLALKARGTSSFGGLSGLDVEPDGRFVSQTDEGDLVRGRLVLDAAGRLTGVADATIQRMTDETGQALGAKVDSDAEDITLLPDGGYAVSFEQEHRVLRYPPGGGAGVRLAISPDMKSRMRNLGLEALAYKDGRLYEGAEDGEIWRCRIAPVSDTHACESVIPTSPFPGFKLTGLDAAGPGFVAVYRTVGLLTGWRATIAWLQPADAEGRGPWTARRLAVLERPLTRDNMEGIAALPAPGGGFRLYLVSDDNFAGFQRTLLIAFDWKGPPPAAEASP